MELPVNLHLIDAPMSNQQVSDHFPQNIAVVVSLTFIVFVLLSALFFTALVRYFNGNLFSNVAPTVVAIVALTVSSLPIGLIPIDVFIVSNMKNGSGIFQPWAVDLQLRRHISATVSYAYIACYIIVILDIFLVIPIAYFFHKCNESDRSRRLHREMITAIGCCSLFLCGLILLLTIGFFIPVEEISDLDTSQEFQFRNLIQELDTQKLEDVFAFVLAVVRIIGIAIFTAYVAVGMAAGPIGQLRGYLDPLAELSIVRNRRLGIEMEIAEIQRHQHEGQTSSDTLLDGIELASTEQIRILELEHEDLDLRERVEQLQQTTRHWITHLIVLSRPLQIAVGLMGTLAGLLVFVSLFMNNILRAMFSLGEPFGYLMPVVTVLNPLDRSFLSMEHLFPLDYTLFVILAAFVVVSAVSGICRIGIGIPWIKVYDVVPLKTESRSLLAVTMSLAVILLTLDTLMLAMLPQYMTYGSQSYISCPESALDPSEDIGQLPTPLSYSQNDPCQDSADARLVPCDWNAPKDQCVMTRISAMWSRLSFKNWYCGALFYWITWLFLAVIILEATFAMIRPLKQKSVDESVEDADQSSSVSDNQ